MNKPISTYREACSYLDDLQMHKIKLGLDAMRRTLAELGSPETVCPAVHIAGTNGKGSVCSMLRTTATLAGYKTGMYTSPHLDSVRERFRIDDDYIGRDDFTRLMEKIRSSLGDRRITYFECTTALAFLWFAENGCDLILLETGMGGRLDATNVVTPLLSVITSISLDHEQYLGDTIEQVAYEKAGIIKTGVPVIAGVDDPVAQEVIERACAEREAPLQSRDVDFRMERGHGQPWTWKSATKTAQLPTLDPHQPNGWQVDNISLVVAAAHCLDGVGVTIRDEVLDRGIAATRWPGRMELIDTGRRYLLDGAHNRAGVDSLIRSLKNYQYENLVVVWASMGDKSYAAMLNDIANIADTLVLTRPDSERAAQTEELLDSLELTGAGVVTVCDTVEQAQIEAERAAGENDLIVVAGSLYLIGEFRAHLVGRVTGDG